MKGILLIAVSMLFSTAALAGVHPKCDDYFDAIDSYTEDAKKKYGDDANAMVEQFSQAEDMIKELPEEHQEVTCTQGIKTIKQARQAAGL